MKSKARIRFLKELEWWDKKRGVLYGNGKSKYRYIWKRTCRDKRKGKLWNYDYIIPSFH